MPWPLIGFVAAGFFSGSILYSLILPKWIKGVDIVAVSDDHNPGPANAMKYAGKLVGIWGRDFSRCGSPPSSCR